MEKSRLADLRSLSRRPQDPAKEVKIPRPAFNWKTHVLIPGAILGGFVLLFGITVYREILPSPVVEAQPVIAKAFQGAATGTVTVQAAGWIEAAPYKSYVTALADGIVKEVLVLEGEPVHKDQVVVRLIDEDARLAVERFTAQASEREANLAAARADLAAAQTEWDNPVERERAIQVYAAQVGENRATTEQLASEIALEEAVLVRTRSDYERAKGLYASNSISEAELIRLQSRSQAQEAKLEASRMRHAAAKEAVAKSEADLKAARELMALRSEERRKLDRAQAAVAQEEALLLQSKTAVAEARLRLERMEIRSPMDGMVMARLTEPGSKVVIMSDNPGSARVISLYDPARLQVRVDVPLAEAAKVGAGQLAEIVVEVLPERTFSGAITRVLHEANIQKNTLEVKVALSDPDPKLRPEMLARVKFLANANAEPAGERQRLFVPESAVRNQGGSSTLWVVEKLDGDHGMAASRQVRIGNAKTGGWTEIAEGLQQGDLVVTRTTVELTPGCRIKVQMN